MWHQLGQQLGGCTLVICSLCFCALWVLCCHADLLGCSQYKDAGCIRQGGWEGEATWPRLKVPYEGTAHNPPHASHTTPPHVYSMYLHTPHLLTPSSPHPPSHTLLLLPSCSHPPSHTLLPSPSLIPTLQNCGVADASQGSFSSYAYILMVIHFLQRTSPPVVPVLQLVRSTDPPHYVWQWYTCVLMCSSTGIVVMVNAAVSSILCSCLKKVMSVKLQAGIAISMTSMVQMN